VLVVCLQLLQGAGPRGAAWAETRQAAAVPESLRDDASLHAVTFADVDRGWAVGDRGVIWHSDNGGDSWQPQASGTTRPLFDVSFADPRRGIAVGGWYEPETQISHAVVLVTTNGGRRWERVTNDLPLLRHVALAGQGAAVVGGDYSPLHLSSLFQSEDGGRGWTPMLPGELRGVAALAGPATGPLDVLDQQGLVHRYRDLAAPPRPSLASQTLRDLAGVSARRLAIGVDGVAFQSRDQGAHWQPLPLPAGAAAEWLAAEAAAGHFWAVGYPGDQILHINPQGEASLVASGHEAPLRDLDFWDAQRGWAVGAFGTILATRDGGVTWRVQRGGGRRAALLAVAAAPEQLPWPALASESLEMGRRFAVCLVPAAEGGQASAEQAGAQLGGAQQQAAAGGDDPLAPRPSGLTQQVAASLGGGEVLQLSPAGTPAVAIERVLRSYAPQVLVLDGTLDRATRQAWRQAAMRRDVSRIWETCAPAGSELSVHAGAILPRAGAITGDLWREAWSVLQPALPCPQTLGLRTTFDARASSRRASSGLFDGLPVGDPADSRPLAEQASRRLLQVLRARAGQHSIAAKLVQEGDQRGAFISRLDLLLGQTPREARPQLLQEVLARCRRADRPQLYRQALEATSQALSEQPLGRLATLRLQALQGSEEWQMMQRGRVAPATIAVASSTAAASVKLSPFAEDPPPRSTPGGAGRAEPPRRRDSPQLDPQELVQTAVTWDRERVLAPNRGGTNRRGPAADAEIDLTWDFDPRVLLVREAGRRQAAAKRATAGQAGARDAEPLADVRRWRDAAAMAGWARLAGVTPASEHPVARAVEPPRLDARLEDACWQEASVVPTADGGSWRLAYDRDYFYWSYAGPAAENETKPREGSARGRDADLQPEPRAVLRIDLEGDLMTSFVLEVSPRGATRDTCDGFVGWHPMWFVDSQVRDGRWVIEAAVRRQDLQPLPLMAGDRWHLHTARLAAGQALPLAPLPSAHGWTVARFR